METIIICLLVMAIALLIYAISQGKKEKNNVLHNGPITGLPNIIGMPKDNPGQSSLSTIAQHKRENNGGATDNFNNRNAGNPQVSEIPQEGPEVAESEIPDWKEEEEEMERYTANVTDEGFATGVTFDELASVGKMLGRQALEPSEITAAACIASKIDGTELLGLLESKIDDASKRIAMLLDRMVIAQPQKDFSNNSEVNFDINDLT